jgi:hypothetical protein
MYPSSLLLNWPVVKAKVMTKMKEIIASDIVNQFNQSLFMNEITSNRLYISQKMQIGGMNIFP